MDFQFTVNASAERVQGKFESRDTIETAIVEWLEAANEGNIEGDNGGEYEIGSWEVAPGDPSGFKAKPKKEDGSDLLFRLRQLRQTLEAARTGAKEGASRAETAAQTDRALRLFEGIFNGLVDKGVIKP